MSASLRERLGVGCAATSCVWGSPATGGADDPCSCLAHIKAADDDAEAWDSIGLLRALAAHPQISLALEELVLAARASGSKAC